LHRQFNCRLAAVLNFQAPVKRRTPQELSATNSDAVTHKINGDDYAVVADCRTYQFRTFIIDGQEELRKEPCVLVIDAAFGQDINVAEEIEHGEGIAVFDRVGLIFHQSSYLIGIKQKRRSSDRRCKISAGENACLHRRN
jgi:hypothetical protein